MVMVNMSLLPDLEFIAARCTAAMLCIKHGVELLCRNAVAMEAAAMGTLLSNIHPGMPDAPLSCRCAVPTLEEQTMRPFGGMVEL
jgi:hypothetical protein